MKRQDDSENQSELQEGEDDEALFEHFRFTVDKGQEPVRIDKFLMGKIAAVSRNKIQHAADDEMIRVNGKPVKSNYKVRPADVIVIMLPEPKMDFETLPENIPLHIVYEDEDVIIVNKPAGMVVHPGAGNYTGTLVNGLLYHFQHLPAHSGNQFRPGLVHRIDKDTSGLLVVAKNDHALNFLAKQFSDHSVKRTYWALVWGDFKEDEGTIIGHIGRSLKNRKVMDVFPEGDYGKEAITHYRVLERFMYVTLVECTLETGRTHQIRVHMQHIRHPLFNDATYGGDKIVKGTVYSKYKQFVENCFSLLPRQALHAKSIGFIHPVTKEEMYFDSQLPEDFGEVLKKWERFTGKSH